MFETYRLLMDVPESNVPKSKILICEEKGAIMTRQKAYVLKKKAQLSIL